MSLVVFLRGVNVGGHKTFRPMALAEQLQHLDVVNIGAAGTFVIRRPVGRTQLRALVASHLPFDADIMICEGRSITQLMSQDFFLSRSADPDVVRFVSVLARRPRSAPELPLKIPSKGQWQLQILACQERFVVGQYRRNMKAIGHLGRVDEIFKERATTRNWNTLTKIATVLEK